MILVKGCDLVIYTQQHKHNGFLQLHSFPDNLKIQYNIHCRKFSMGYISLVEGVGGGRFSNIFFFINKKNE